MAGASMALWKTQTWVMTHAEPALPVDTAAPLTCYHCGEDVPPGMMLTANIAGESRPMCCPGCRAVASLIAASGMESFYLQRTAYNVRPDDNNPTTDSDARYEIYDDPELAAAFTRVDADGQVTAQLLLGGVSCAACTWLIEQSLSRLPGIRSAIVNLQQSRLDVRFDPAQLPLSRLFASVEALGYSARPYQSHARRQQLAQQRRSDLRQLAVAGVGMMQVGMFAIALHAGDIQGIEAEYQTLLRWVSLVVASFVVYFSARPFFVSAWRHLRMGSLVMDLPVALAIGLAFTASVWATLTQQGQVYFDSVVMFTFFLLLGRFLEQRVRQRHMLAWFDAESALPATVPVLCQGNWQNRARVKLVPGERILIRPGMLVPVDAQVLVGNSSVVEDTFNGEHLPRQVAVADTVYAGTINVEGALEAQVLGRYEDTRLAALQQSVETAQTNKPAVAQLADRVASWFVAGILLVTVATAIIWSYLDPDRALWVTLSVLVISCPCALALATPAALTSAAGALRARGIITRGENALEALSRATHLVFDKTGTLTEGQLRITAVHSLSAVGRDQCLALAAALQQYSNHPVARAFAGLAQAPDMKRVVNQTGAGLEGECAGIRYRIGSETYCREIAPDLPPPPEAPLYWVALCQRDQPLAWIGLDDELRPEAAAVVTEAVGGGLQLELLTGDSSDQGEVLAAQLGIATVHTGMQPEEKMQRVRALQNGGAVVAMVGDGLNDAPVLALADASFAVAGATDLARTQADFVIVGGDLYQVLFTWRKARQCRHIIRLNLGWALAYNLCAIPLAASGYIPPWAAALGMSASSLLVVLNSLRLNSAPHD